MTWRSAGWALGLWLALATPVRAQLALLSAEDSPPRPGLASSLRIHLPHDLVVIDAGTLRADTTTSERIEQALGAAELHHAEAAMWVEGPLARADGHGEIVLYLVGHRTDRAIVDVLRVDAPDAEASSIDRLLALKVSDVLSAVSRGDDVIDSELAEADALRADAARWQLLLCLGGLVHLGSGSVPAQPGLRARMGAQRVEGRHAWSLALRAHVWPSHVARSTEGSVRLSEQSFGLEATWLYAAGGIAFGARLGPVLRSVDAEGVTELGARGSRHAWLFGLGGGPVLALRLSSIVQVEAGVLLESSWARRRYAINAHHTTDTGWLRAALHVDLVGALP